MWCAQKLNDVLAPLIPQKYAGRNIIDIEPVYSCEKAEKQLKTIQLPYQGGSLYPVTEQPILSYVPEVIAQYIKHPMKRIVLWGNFLYEEIATLRGNIYGEIIVMSNDRIYCNHLYKQIRSHQDNIAVICCNVMRGKDFKVLNALKTDILILQDEVYKQAHIGSHSDWAERASLFSEYILTSTLPKEEIESCRMNSFYSLQNRTTEFEVQLYLNTHQYAR